MNPANNPSAWSGAITALAVATIPFLRSFNIYDMTKDQADAILTLLGVVIVVATLFLHTLTTTKVAAQAKIDVAFAAPADAPASAKPVA